MDAILREFFFLDPRPVRFQEAIKKYGVPQAEVFQTADLFERRNLKQVTLCLLALARVVSPAARPVGLGTVDNGPYPWLDP